MNENLKQTLTITLTGTLTIAPDQLEQLLRRMPAPTAPVVEAPASRRVEDDGKLPRLAYTMKETAEILGCSYITVHRLLQRGLLKSSSALRCKIISKAEIERFLAESSRSAF
jgi:hypothetical protein